MEEKVYGLLGRKLGHSWSVPIHAALGNNAYRLIELEPEDLAPFLKPAGHRRPQRHHPLQAGRDALLR